MSQRFALRADLSPSAKEKVSEWCSKHADGFIVAYEVAGENTHIHAILETAKNLKSLRNFWTRAFPECTGNKGYSLKLCDDNYEAYIRYICKGGSKDAEPSIWCHQGLHYTAQAIKDAHAKYWVNNDAIAENARKRVKVEKENVIEQLERSCKAKGITGSERVRVAECYIALFTEARKGINVYAAKAVVNTVCCLLEGCEPAQRDLAYKISEL